MSALWIVTHIIEFTALKFRDFKWLVQSHNTDMSCIWERNVVGSLRTEVPEHLGPLGHAVYTNQGLFSLFLKISCPKFSAGDS